MFRPKHAPDLIRGGRRFADKNMRKQENPGACPDSIGTGPAPGRKSGLLHGGPAIARLSRICREVVDESATTVPPAVRWSRRAIRYGPSDWPSRPAGMF